MTVTLSQAGLALIVLEGQIAQETLNRNKWAARERDARENRIRAEQVLQRHYNTVQRIREEVKV